MASVLHKFEELTKILPSQINENFEFLQEDITTLSESVDSKLSSTKESILGDIEVVKSSLKESIQGLDELPHIIKVSDKSLLPSWYRIYSDGWCEQGGSGKTDSAGNARVNLFYNYLSVNQFNALVAPTQWIFADSNVSVGAKNLSYIDIYGMTWTNATTGRGVAITFDWKTSGYINLEEIE